MERQRVDKLCDAWELLGLGACLFIRDGKAQISACNSLDKGHIPL
jgi:hypothetical protein